MEITPANLRKLAEGDYSPATIRSGLNGAADDLQTALDAIVERDMLLNHHVMTLAAVVKAAGNNVLVPADLVTFLEGCELEKAPGLGGGTLYAVRDAGGENVG